MNLVLSILPDTFSICRLSPSAQFPGWVTELSFWSAVRTAEELSLVLPESAVPPGWLSEPGWRALKVHGPLDFNLTGILAGLCTPLAENGISVFAISTYDTDYILVRSGELGKARQALESAGCRFSIS